MKEIIVLIIWLGMAGFVSYTLIGNGHWITGAILMMMAMSGISISWKN